MTNSDKTKSCSYSTNEIWGPVYWDFLHMFCANYKVENMESYKTLIKIFADTLPCCECKTDFGNIIDKFDFSSRESLFNSSVEIHNIVNQRLGKDVYPLDVAHKKYADFLDDIYIADSESESSYRKKKNNRSNYKLSLFFVSLFAIISIVLFFILAI